MTPLLAALESSLGTLPSPDSDARAVSAALLERILEEMARHAGLLPFDRYMELALYAPGLGYYSNDLRKFGEGGDFITAPELSPLFGGCIANQCLEVLHRLGGGDILEFGAGSGRLAADILTGLDRLGHLPHRYVILELSAGLRQRQQELLGREVPHLAGRIEWLDRLPEQFRGVVIANEVLDAMPVHRFRVGDDGIQEQFVRWDGDRLATDWGKPHSHLLDRVAGVLIERYRLPAGYESEANLRATSWINELARCLDCGLVLLIDYGYNGREFYHPQRDRGTLICHYRHRVHSDPLTLPGLQDITANVDFTAIAEAGLASGFDQVAFTSQAWFLMGSGLEQQLAELPGFADDPRAHMRHLQAVKRLTLPNEMGERFKVLGLAKGIGTLSSGLVFHNLPLS